MQYYTEEMVAKYAEDPFDLLGESQDLVHQQLASELYKHQGNYHIDCLLDVAIAGNYVNKPSAGWYCRVDKSTGELVEPKVREKETLNEEFWKPIIEDTDFKDYITKKYSIVNGNINLSKMDQH